MVARRYSARAKKGTRSGIDLRIRFLKANISSLKSEKARYKKYLNKGLNDSFIRRAIRNIDRTVRIRTRQLRRYEARRADYKKRGLI